MDRPEEAGLPLERSASRKKGKRLAPNISRSTNFTVTDAINYDPNYFSFSNCVEATKTRKPNRELVKNEISLSIGFILKRWLDECWKLRKRCCTCCCIASELSARPRHRNSRKLKTLVVAREPCWSCAKHLFRPECLHLRALQALQQLRLRQRRQRSLLRRRSGRLWAVPRRPGEERLAGLVAAVVDAGEGAVVLVEV